MERGAPVAFEKKACDELTLLCVGVPPLSLPCGLCFLCLPCRTWTPPEQPCLPARAALVGARQEGGAKYGGETAQREAGPAPLCAKGVKRGGSIGVASLRAPQPSKRAMGSAIVAGCSVRPSPRWSTGSWNRPGEWGGEGDERRGREGEGETGDATGIRGAHGKKLPRQVHLHSRVCIGARPEPRPEPALRLLRRPPFLGAEPRSIKNRNILDPRVWSGRGLLARRGGRGRESSFGGPGNIRLTLEAEADIRFGVFWGGPLWGPRLGRGGGGGSADTPSFVVSPPSGPHSAPRGPGCVLGSAPRQELYSARGQAPSGTPLRQGRQAGEEGQGPEHSRLSLQRDNLARSRRAGEGQGRSGRGEAGRTGRGRGGGQPPPLPPLPPSPRGSLSGAEPDSPEPSPLRAGVRPFPAGRAPVALFPRAQERSSRRPRPFSKGP